MPTFKLPRGYSFTDPAQQTATVPDKGYGGADISQAFDAAGVHYVACNAWGPGDPSFRWRAFKRVGARYVEVPLPFLATGRGEQGVQPYDGKDWAIAWTNETFQFDVIPGFASFPSIPSLEQRIAELETRLNAALTVVNGSALTLLPQGGEEGGELILAGGEGQPDWHIDVYAGKLRFHVGGKVVAEWG